MDPKYFGPLVFGHKWVTNFDPEIKIHLRMEHDSGVGPTW